MKLPGLTHKLHAGKHPHDRHGAMRYGDDLSDAYADRVNQFIGFAEFVIKDGSRGWWTRNILPDLEHELRHAINKRNGRFFHTLAALIDARAKSPTDPLGEWIDRELFQVVSDAKGTRTEQPHEGETSEDLHHLFRKSHHGYKVSFEVFTKKLREHGVRWSKRPGGPKKRRRL